MTRRTVIIAGILVAFAWGCTDAAPGNLPDSDSTDTGMASDGDADGDADGDSDSDADADNDADADSDADADTDTDVDADADNDADGDADNDADGDADNDADGDADNDADADTDNDADSDTDNDADGDADTDADSDTDTDADSDSDTDGDSDSDSDADADCNSEPLVLDNHPPAAEDYTETVNGVSIDMVYIPGGTFTLGCESGSCPADTTPVSGVTVSSYHIAKNQVSTAVWSAVMGEDPGFSLMIDWYDCLAFACELSRQTGRAYRMQTEAEFEYAAKNYLSSLEQIDGTEEWAYNSWSKTHMGGTDPVGSASGKHTQKTRRDAASGDNITGRLIRSIDGIGPQCRLAISNTTELPPDYVPPCDICRPAMSGEPENSYRDPRWVTGSDAHWVPGAELGFGQMDLRVWEDGTARQGNKDGQWFTSNNIVFVFVPNSGSIQPYPYIFLDETQGSLLSQAGFGMGGFIGRIAKESADSVDKPTITDLKSGEELAAAAGPDYKMVDMVNIPESAKKQDPRLLDGPDDCWFQNNINAGGTHNYRKDVDPDEFRFVVIDKGNSVMLANGNWFTVNNVFLRITHSTGYVTDYLYALSSDGGTFYHDSYQGYERADFRMFQIYSNTTGDFPPTCIGDSCINEIPKGQAASFYANDAEKGQSTFVPAPCPATGCY